MRHIGVGRIAISGLLAGVAHDEGDGRRRLPWIVKVAVALAFFNSWVLFEETIVDRHGLWHYLPFYKVGLFCTWDMAALLIIVPGVWYAFRKWRLRSAGARN